MAPSYPVISTLTKLQAEQSEKQKALEERDMTVFQEAGRSYDSNDDYIPTASSIQHLYCCPDRFCQKLSARPMLQRRDVERSSG